MPRPDPLPPGLHASDFLSPQVFHRLAELVEERMGLRLPDAKKSLVESRLRRRARALGLVSLRDYVRLYLETPRLDEELPEVINALTTNKTDFFREPAHFTYLTERVLPALRREGIGRVRPLRLWSAACSIGAEPYTLAMILTEVARLDGPFQFTIMGFDIDSTALEAARRAVFDTAFLGPIPEALRQRYILRARSATNHTFRMAPEIRRCVSFQPLNLLAPEWPSTEPPDIIFCRNVLIYFNRGNQQRALDGLCGRLRPGGLLFVGHSESLHGLSLPVRALAPATYQRL